MIDFYDWAGGREAMLRFGPDTCPVVVVAQPLFEEANRTRAFLVAMLRALAGRGVGSALPDLPATGESLVPTREASIQDWRAAFAAAVVGAGEGGRRVHVAAIRGGALIDRDAQVASRWQFAPAAGDALVRDLLRARSLAEPAAERYDPAEPGDEGPPLLLAGNEVPRALLRELHVAVRSNDERTRVVRLETDPAVADRKVAGSPLWRRAEPGNDAALAALLAEDLADWIRSCAP